MSPPMVPAPMTWMRLPSHLPLGEVFKVVAQEEDPHQILRGVADQEFGEGGNLRPLRGFAASPPCSTHRSISA